MPVKKPSGDTVKIEALTTVPKPPTRMKGKHAIAYWKRVVRMLVENRSITALHLEPLETLCNWWQQYCEATEWMAKNPNNIIHDYANYQKVDVRVEMQQKAYDNMARLWPRFGMTPEGLGKITKANKELKMTDDNEQDEIFKFAAKKYQG